MLLLAGCASAPPAPKATTGLPAPSAPPPTASVHTPTPAVHAPPPPPAALEQAPPPTQAAQASVAPQPTAPIAPPKAAVNGPTLPAVPGWVDWLAWVEENGLGRVRPAGSAAEPVSELHTGLGVFALAAGQRNARWNGILLGLGFAPRVAAGRWQVHSLDLEKNLLPLLSPDAPPAGEGRLIVIDAGHGGSNAGAISVYNARPEKELTLDWARRLEVLLRTNGWQVMLTRTNDLELDLAARAAFADWAGADLFVSLHFNTAAPNPAPAGLETYCVTPVGLPSNLTRNYPDPPHRALPNNAYDGLNLQWSVRIHRALLQATGALDRGVRRARFMDVIALQRRPAVLVEGGYLSHPAEARLIATPHYRQRLAEALAQAIGPARPAPLLATPPAASDSGGAGR